MDINDLIIEYRVQVNGELQLEGAIYQEWFRQLFVVYAVDGNVVTVFTNNEWQQLFP